MSYGQIYIDLNNKAEINTKINQLYKNGEWETAKNWLLKSIEKYPNDSEFRILIGKYYIENKQFQQAFYELNKSLEINPNNLDAKKLLLQIETEAQRYSSAIGYVNELLEASPYSKELWLKKIDLNRQQGNQTEANRLLKRLADIYPEDHLIAEDVNYQMEITVNQKNQQGRYDDAIELNKKLLNSNQQHLPYYLNLINTYIKTGDYSSALAITERGLNQFPNQTDLVLKRLSLYNQSQQYEAGLTYIKQQKKNKSVAHLNQQYDYFLNAAAQAAKNRTVFVLFGKVLEKHPGDSEAFEIVFNQLVSQHQYEEALGVLKRHRQVRGNTKKLDSKELTLYKALGYTSKTNTLIRKLNADYPQDFDLEAAYVRLTLSDAKEALENSNYPLAIDLWKIAQQFGDEEQRNIANTGLYHAYLQTANYYQAELTIELLLHQQPKHQQLYFKKSDLYYLMQRPNDALAIYEEGIQKSDTIARTYALIGYEELMVKIIKDALKEYAIPTAFEYTERWLIQEPLNKQALEYAISFATTMKQWETVKYYTQLASKTYVNDVALKLKLAEALQLGDRNFEGAVKLISEEIKTNPYHEKSSAAFIDLVTTYSEQLLKDKKSERVIELTNAALNLDSKNKELKYLKGLALEQQKNDSAYYYQQYYEPTLIEFSSFKHHLYYLYHRSLKNEIGINHTVSWFEDKATSLNITGLDYRYTGKDQQWTGRLNYSGRTGGQGVQGIAEWTSQWSSRWSHQLILGFANDYFPKIIAQGSILHNWKKEWETEIGIGFRRLPDDQNLYNLLLGVYKEFQDFRISLKLNQFSIGNKWLYNLGLSGNYFMESRKDYLLFQSGIGSSTDVDIIDIQNLNTFSINNTQVGVGMGRLISKNVSANIMGTWHNFKNQSETVVYENENNSNPTEAPNLLDYRNFYTLYFNIYVAF